MCQRFVVIVLLMCSCIAVAQKKNLDLTLQQSSQIMLKNNNSLKIVDMTINSAKVEKMKLNSFWYPVFNAAGAFVHSSNSIEVKQSLSQLTTPLKELIGNAYPDDQAIIGILSEIGSQDFIVPLFKRNITTVDANLIWPIFTGGKRIYSSRIANRMIDLAKIDKKSTSANLQAELISTYFGVRLAMKVVDVRFETLNTLKLHYDNALKLEKHGMLNKAERLVAQVSMDEAKREYESSKKSLDVAQNALATLLNIDTVNVINPMTSLFINDNIPDKEYFKNQLSSTNYTLKKLHQEYRIADNQLKISKSNYFPTISFVGKQNIYNYNVPKNLIPRTMVGLDFTWNLFDGLSREAGIRKANIDRMIVQTGKQKALNDYALAVDEFYSKIKDAQDNVMALNTTIEMSKELLRVRKKSFVEGMATSTDVVDAQTLLSKVQISYLMAYYQYDISLASLLSACGIPEEFWIYSESGKTEDFIFK